MISQQQSLECSLFPIYAGEQIQGMRNRQEDSFLLIPSDPLLFSDWALVILSDGMGGYSGGATASREISATFAESFIKETPKGNLLDSLHEANSAIGTLKHNHLLSQDAGATFIALYVHDGQYTWVSVGDSLLYLFRKGQLIPLNQKHTWEHELDRQVRAGLITAEEAASYPQRNALFSALCGDDIAAVDAPDHTFSLELGDRFILSSDGLTPILPELQNILNNPKIQKELPSEVCSSLLEYVSQKKLPNQDNTTLIILDIVEPRTRVEESLPLPLLALDSCTVSLLGDREEQQDACGVWMSSRAMFAVVADGSGGHRGGGHASSTAVATLQELWEKQLSQDLSSQEAAVLIEQSMINIHQDLVNAQGGNATRCGKCAIIALYVYEGMYTIVHVGDCRLYHGTALGWKKKTQDDSILQKLLDAKRISPEEAVGHPDQEILTQALGASSQPEPHITYGIWSNNDSFLLCCDGFWNQLPHSSWSPAKWRYGRKEAKNILQVRVKEAIRAAKGNSDNVTAIWIYPQGDETWSNPPHMRYSLRCQLVIILTLILVLLGLVVFQFYLE
ncbi:MAG: serine/threonine-protein phosphatase [Akkermansia sp.]